MSFMLQEFQRYGCDFCNTERAYTCAMILVSLATAVGHSVHAPRGCNAVQYISSSRRLQEFAFLGNGEKL